MRYLFQRDSLHDARHGVNVGVPEGFASVACIVLGTMVLAVLIALVKGCA